MLWFDDADRQRCIYDNEDEAREAFDRAESMGWNCYLFAVARRVKP